MFVCCLEQLLYCSMITYKKSFVSSSIQSYCAIFTIQWTGHMTLYITGVWKWHFFFHKTIHFYMAMSENYLMRASKLFNLFLIFFFKGLGFLLPCLVSAQKASKCTRIGNGNFWVFVCHFVMCALQPGGRQVCGPAGCRRSGQPPKKVPRWVATSPKAASTQIHGGLSLTALFVLNVYFIDLTICLLLRWPRSQVGKQTVTTEMQVRPQTEPRWEALDWQQRASLHLIALLFLPPQIASSRCVPWTDTRHRSSSGRQNRANRETTTRRGTCSKNYRCHIDKTIVHIVFSTLVGTSGTSLSLSLSMPLSWSRSRMSRRTRSSWERLSNTVTSSRYVPHLFSKHLWFPSGPCPDLCFCVLKLCICHCTVWPSQFWAFFASLNLWPEEALSCCVAHKWLHTLESVLL